MIGGADQSAVIMLAVDLGQGSGNLAEKIEADRLIIHAGAAGSIGILNPSEDQLAIGFDILACQDVEGRMRFRQRESRGDDALFGAAAYQSAVAPRPQCQSERI